ncbi:hypothetical protein SPBR_05980 [Sporothrix brasiliensis 5110]|uniref:Tetraspanin tsp3 n=1 Tax=Sporothrix brasiliensis 5110 TaxID=1398154 RepID=A0A0C2J4S5_9PEZI|nr:uncharacterized protein SPBR_05980 [Sporothrix brasiliensis 5110]KIH94025.1 hypothetical protein SPBR_05980 [Sporothrix brasiliensis 5110]
MSAWSWLYLYPVVPVTVLAIVLPVVSFASTIVLPAALTADDGSNNNNSSSGRVLVFARRRPLLVASLVQALNAGQVLLAVVLAVLFLERTAPSAVRACVVGTAWQHLFATKNAAVVRRIQDALDCCGFNSVRDRAWPFAEDIGRGGGGGGGGAACAERFGRTQACAAPWTAALERTSGVEGGVAAGVLLLQAVLYFAAPWVAAALRQRQRQQQQSQRHRNTQSSPSESGWTRLLLPFAAGEALQRGRNNNDNNDGIRRPLLGTGHGDNGPGDGHGAHPPPNGGYVYDEDNNADEQPNGDGGDAGNGHENNRNGETVDEEQARPAGQNEQSPSQYGSIAPHDAWGAE